MRGACHNRLEVQEGGLKGRAKKSVFRVSFVELFSVFLLRERESVCVCERLMEE